MDDKFDYNLRGIVVHTGNAEGGHYYCLIKDVNTGAWFKFDDQQVLPFDENDIPSEAFGSTVVEPVGYSDRSIEAGMRHKNGYMLFYDRVATSAASRPTETVASVSSDLRKDIDEDNVDIGLQRMLFDQAYINFVLALLQSAVDLGSNWKDDHLGSSVFPVFQLGCFFMFETVLRARERDLFVKLGTVLSALAHRCPLGCKWFLRDITDRRGSWMRYGLFESNDDSVRTAVSNLIVSCLKSLAPIENDPVLPLPSDSPILIPFALLAFTPDPPALFGPARMGDTTVLNSPVPTIEELKALSVTDLFVNHCFLIVRGSCSVFLRWLFRWPNLFALFDLLSWSGLDNTGGALRSSSTS